MIIFGMCSPYASSYQNIFYCILLFLFFLLLSLFFEVYNPDIIKQLSRTKVRFKLLNDLKNYKRELWQVEVTIESSNFNFNFI